MDLIQNLDLEQAGVVLLIIAGVSLLLLIVGRRTQAGTVQLRPIRGYAALKESLDRAAESATPLHITLGRAGLSTPASPASVAAVNVLDRAAEEGSINRTPPIVTTGDGTLLLIAQQSLKRAFRQAQHSRDYEPHLAQFIASHADPFAYAGGISGIVRQKQVAGNVLIGHFGTELPIMTHPASREGVVQIVGADEPVAMALGSAATENVLIGEELFAAAAYLQGRKDQVAMLRVHDIIRTVAAVIVVGLAIYRLVQGS